MAAWNTYYAQRFGTRGQKLEKATSVGQLRDMLGMDQGRRNLAYLDLISRLSRERVFDVRQIHFYELPSAIPELLTYLTATTDPSVPIEAWEVGIFDKTGADAASSDATTNIIVQSMALLLAGGVKRAIWLPLATNPNNKAGSEVRAGVLEPDGTERPAAATVRLMVDASRDATIEPPPSSRVSGALFTPTTGGGSTSVLWSDRGQVDLPLQSGDTVAALGEDTPAAADSASIGTDAVVVESTRRAEDVLSGLG